MFRDGLFVDLEARSGFGIEQGIQMPARTVGLIAPSEPRLGPHGSAEKWDVTVVGVEATRHAAAAEGNGVDDIGSVYVAESHTGTVSLQGPGGWTDRAGARCGVIAGDARDLPLRRPREPTPSATVTTEGCLSTNTPTSCMRLTTGVAALIVATLSPVNADEPGTLMISGGADAVMRAEEFAELVAATVVYGLFAALSDTTTVYEPFEDDWDDADDFDIRISALQVGTALSYFVAP